MYFSFLVFLFYLEVFDFVFAYNATKVMYPLLWYLVVLMSRANICIAYCKFILYSYNSLLLLRQHTNHPKSSFCRFILMDQLTHSHLSQWALVHLLPWLSLNQSLVRDFLWVFTLLHIERFIFYISLMVNEVFIFLQRDKGWTW